jgi:hypothetical protein
MTSPQAIEILKAHTSQQIPYEVRIALEIAISVMKERVDILEAQ